MDSSEDDYLQDQFQLKLNNLALGLLDQEQSLTSPGTLLRAAFEAWLRRQHLNPARYNGRYMFHEEKWQGWQACVEAIRADPSLLNQKE